MRSNCSPTPDTEPLEAAAQCAAHEATGISLGIPPAGRPFSQEDAVLACYDGPLLMVLESPVLGLLLAQALPLSAGVWPFLVVPTTPEAVAELRLPRSQLRGWLTSAQTAYLLRDYGAQDLVVEPLPLPLPEEWLPSVGF